MTSFWTPLAFSIVARTRMRPTPAWYSETSIRPPWGKSGYSSIFPPLRIETMASISSPKLWGRMVVAMPTAMPSAPSIRSTGTLAGSSFGSWRRPAELGTYSGGAGVELHRLADDVGDLVELAVVHLVQRVEDAALHGLAPVPQAGDGPVHDDVTRVVEEVAPHEGLELALGAHGLIAGRAAPRRWIRLRAETPGAPGAK